MKIETSNTHTALLWTAVLATAASVLALALPPIPQDPAYHKFADSRVFLNMPNVLDVLSNIPLVVLGIIGIALCVKKGDTDPAPEADRLKILLFMSVVLTGVGSFIYHRQPDNFSILWDRLPLSVMFMAAYLVILADRISPRIASALFWPTLVAGPASVLYWYGSELQGSGDLRFYGIVQLLPLLLMPATMILRPKGLIENSILLKAFAWYALAKIFEFLDGPVFEWTGFISGHTLKHLCAGVAVYCLLSICRKDTAVAH